MKKPDPLRAVKVEKKMKIKIMNSFIVSKETINAKAFKENKSNV